MYSIEDRLRAVELHVRYGGRSAAVRRELGYPTKNALKQLVGGLKIDVTHRHLPAPTSPPSPPPPSA